MFNSSLIVFRESLEAALLVGIIAAGTKGVAKRNWWVLLGVFAGLIGSYLVSLLMGTIVQYSSGQELFNAAILSLAISMIAWHSIFNKKPQIMGKQKDLLAAAIAIAMTVMREGSEAVLFLQSTQSGWFEGLLGLVAGGLIGFVTYNGLIKIPLKKLFTVTNFLLLLVAGGLANNLAKLLIQSDILPSGLNPLWNTSFILPIESTIGNALHIMFGYEASPSAMQALFYFTTVIGIASVSHFKNK